MKRPGVGRVSLVGAGPGDPGLITVRALERVRSAEVLVYDRLVHPSLVAEAPRRAERVFAGKARGARALDQDAINAVLIDRARRGRQVVRLKGGDPFVFGRGGEEALALQEAGIPFEVVPGVSSSVAAAAYAGIPVTHRGLASAVTIVSGCEDPEKCETAVDWEVLARTGGTLVVLMGWSNLPAIVSRLLAGGRSGATPAALIQSGTWPTQRVVSGTLATIADRGRAAGLESPVIAVIGEVARLRSRLRWFDLAPLAPAPGPRIAVGG